MPTGNIKWFNRQKGFGFIVSEDGGEVFIRPGDVKGKTKNGLTEGDKVTFTAVSLPSGNVAATEIKPS